MAEVELNEAQNGARLVVHARDTVTVRLNEHSAGSYRWRLTPVDGTRLQIAEHRYERTREGTGSSAASVWTFIPRQPGRTRVELKQLPPWGTADPPARHFMVDLEIRD